VLQLSQPRLKLYTKPIHYLRILRHLVAPYPSDWRIRAETAFAEYSGKRHAIAVSMGRSAVYEGLRTLLHLGDEVILSPLTVPEVINMVILAGGKPVFCDVEPGTWNMNINKLEDLLSPSTRAIMTTHLFGITNTLEPVLDFCNKHGLYCIEDAAQALGAWPNGVAAGASGLLGIYSFSYPKNCSTFYGGMLVTDDSSLAEQVRENLAQYQDKLRIRYYLKSFSSLLKDIATIAPLYNMIVAPAIRHAYRHHIGWLKKFVEVSLTPGNYRVFPEKYAIRFSGLQGRLFCSKFPDVDEDTSWRIKCAETYYQGLEGLSGVLLPPPPQKRCHSYLYFPIEVSDAGSLQRHLISQKIDVALMHLPNCADLEAFRMYYRDCPVARKTAANTLMLPTYPSYRNDQVVKLISAIRRFLDAGQ
jgi:dTDP-4-amino-4,6-dideoxygalactose transaminase